MRTEEFAWQIRRDVVEMAHRSGISHIGSALSVTDIIAVLYHDIMKCFPQDPADVRRDRLILSKGHAGMALYAALAEKGFFDREELWRIGEDGGRLSGHVSNELPGIEFSTGSLGMGLSVAAGMAVAAQRNGQKHRVYTILGDGECAEGSVWEAALFAGHNRLCSLTAVIDHNQLQANDRCENILSWSRIAQLWQACGWHVLEVNGHSVEALRESLSFRHGGKPVCIIAHTIKGKGISFMEDEKIWHHLSPQGADYENAVRELEENRL